MKLGVQEGIPQGDVELVVVDVMQEHVHAGQVVGGVVDLLPEKTVFDDMSVKVFLCLKKQGARTAGGVVNLVDRCLLVHGKLGYQPGYMLRRKELAARFTGIGRVV